MPEVGVGKKNMEIDEYVYGAGGDVEEVDDGARAAHPHEAPHGLPSLSSPPRAKKWKREAASPF